MKYGPQLMLLAAVAVLLGKSLAAPHDERHHGEGPGISLALSPGQVHFRAQLGPGLLSLRF